MGFPDGSVVDSLPIMQESQEMWAKSSACGRLCPVSLPFGVCNLLGEVGAGVCAFIPSTWALIGLLWPELALDKQNPKEERELLAGGRDWS